MTGGPIPGTRCFCRSFRRLRRLRWAAKRPFSVASTIVRRSASHAVLDALRPLCGAPRHTAVLQVSDACLRLKAPFRPSATYFDGAKVGKPPGSVSGPTSSGSFALSLIRGPPQRAILGPVRLARRPASHPPDQRQDSAVTYVALCVVSDIAVKSVFSTIVRRSASHAVLTLCVLFVALRVTQRFCKVSDVCLRLKAPFRPSATYFDGAKVDKPPGSVSGPTSSGSFALSLIRGPPHSASSVPSR
ncbi:hypothetical protein ALO86_101200 [Pseudomonas syringae pv. berberidis]|nr:hypothetical protein ALO86_101200 [Pseudomonas syringae pv. berberidis]